MQDTRLADLHNTSSVEWLELVVKTCFKNGEPISLDMLSMIEEEGLNINEFLDKMENEIHGESNIHDSGWGS
jgi:hypothetical protein